MEAECEVERQRESVSSCEGEEEEQERVQHQEQEQVSLICDEPEPLLVPADAEDETLLVANVEEAVPGEEEEGPASLSSAAEQEEAGAAGGSCEDIEEEERVLRELAHSPAMTTTISGLESFRSESGICSSLESNYQDGATPDELERLESRLTREKETELEKARQEFERKKQAEIQRAIGSKNEEIQRLRKRLQTERQQATAVISTANREATAQSLEQETLRLKTIIRRLEAERDELKAEAQLCRIREKQRSAELRRQRQQHERELRRLLEQDRREGARESRDLAKLRAITEAKDKEIAEREKQIDKLEAQKCYLGEEIFRLTGIEEGFWSDQTLVRASLTDRERGLVRRASELGSKVTQLQVQCRSLQLDNKELRSCIDSELDVPLAIRSRAADSTREAQQLKKKNQELINMTRKLEEKVKTLEQSATETTPEPRQGTRIRPARQIPSSRAVPVEVQLQKSPTIPTGEKRAADSEKTAKVKQRAVSAHERAAGVREKTPAREKSRENTPVRSASVRERTPQRTVGGTQRPLSAGPGGRTLVRPSPERGRDSAEVVTSRGTLTSQQREREAEFQKQIKGKNAEVQRLKQQIKSISDKLSNRNEVQETLREKSKRELAVAIRQLQKQKMETEDRLNVTIEALRQERGADQERLQELREENSSLEEQLRDISQLAEVHQELKRQFEDKADECQQLKEELLTKQKLCQDLENQFTRVIEKNTELTIQNSDLQRQVIELDRISAQCASLEKSLTTVQTEYGTAQMELDNLRGKVSSLESVLKQMRDAAERKKDLERQHQEAQQQLRQKQQQIQTLSDQSERERQGSLDTIRSLESKVRELERKTEAQSLRHEELMLEMSSLKKQNKHKAWLDGSPEGTITPESMLLSNESTARSTPVGTAVTPASVDALTEMDHTPGSSQRRTDILMPTSTTARTVATSLELDKIMAKIENDNKVLAELDKNRSTIGLSNSLANSGSANTQSTFLTASAAPLSAPYSRQGPPISQPLPAAVPAAGFMTSPYVTSLTGPGANVLSAPVSAPVGGVVQSVLQNHLPVGLSNHPASSLPSHLTTQLPSLTSQLTNHLASQLPELPPGQQKGVFLAGKGSVPVNGVIPGLLQPNLAQAITSQTNLARLVAQQTALAHAGGAAANQTQLSGLHQGMVDVLDIPGKGKCQVHIARYSYDPFKHSPNDAPESELRLNAGDFVLVWGTMDEDGFLDGESLDGRRGLVPSNFVQRLLGEDLLEFHRQVVAGLRDCDQTSVSTALPHELDFNSADEFANIVHPRLSKYGAGIRRSMPELRSGGPVAYPAARVYPRARSQHVLSLFSNSDDYAEGYGGYDAALLSDEEDAELRGDTGFAAVPPPRQLTLERQLNKSVVIGWTPADAPPGTVDCYHVYVDGLLRTTVRTNERPRALLEGVDSNKPHRISVRSVTPNRRTSRDAACTMLIGKDVPLAPTAVRATNVTATSAVIAWMPGNSNHQHTVCVNSVEVRTVKPGVYRHTITGISPNTVYRVSVKVKNVTAPQYGGRGVAARERLASHIEFRTLPKGVPDPPVDVQCELGPQEGSVLVTWLPVTINTSGTSNGAPVTGYAVYADGKKVTELDSPTGDHAVIDLQQIHGFHPRQVTVRTKSRDLVSADSLPAPIPQRVSSRLSGPEYDALWPIPEESESELSDPEDTSLMRAQTDANVSAHSSPRARRRIPATGATPRGQYSNHSGPTQTVLEAEENLSDKEMFYGSTYASVPRAEPVKDSSTAGHPTGVAGGDDYDGRGSWSRRRRPLHDVTGSDHAPQRRPTTPHDREPGRSRRRQNDYRDTVPRARPVDNGPGYRELSLPSSSRRSAVRDERMRVFVALFDYDPPTMSPNPDACDEELPFREGQLIKIYGEKDGDGFFWGEASGRAGHVPCNMVSEVQVDDERMAQEMLREEGHYSTRSRSGGHNSGRGRGQEDRWGDIYANTPIRRMVALYDYDPQELSPNVDAEVELSFRTGDIIHIYGEMDDDGFFIGEVKGVRGLVPSNFLTDAPQGYDRRRGQEGKSHEPSSDRRAAPGPGVHGPPVPPRDKGDFRDRRKEPPFSHVEFSAGLVEDGVRVDLTTPTAALTTPTGGSSAGRTSDVSGDVTGAQPPAPQPQPQVTSPLNDAGASFLGGLSSAGGFMRGLGSGLTSGLSSGLSSGVGGLGSVVPGLGNVSGLVPSATPASAAAAPSESNPAAGIDPTAVSSAQGAPADTAAGAPTSATAAPVAGAPGGLMQKLGGVTGEAGGAVEGLMSKGKELIFKRFGF